MKKRMPFLGRKNQSLYDTNIKIPDRESIELVLDSESTISESGTAKVRARPTVKHHASTLETFQGFAVPTPKVPELPPANGLITNGTENRDSLSSGSAVSVPETIEGKIIVPPPPPSKAPPPPPVDFIPPPPDFMGDLNSLDPATLQPPSMPAPKPPFMLEEDLSSLNPPPMAPPKPPSTCSSRSGSSVPISVPPPVKVPEHPKFAPPQPPTEKHQKTQKIPPPKPIRLSSVATTESPPHSPATSPSVHTHTLSTFNPQNKAKIFDSPKTKILSGFDDQSPKPKQMLLLQEEGSVNSAPVVLTIDGNPPQAVQQTKPELKPVQELTKALEITKPSESSNNQKQTKTEVKAEVGTDVRTEATIEAKAETVPVQPNIIKPLHPPPLEKTTNIQINSEINKDKLEVSPGQGKSFSPLLDRKLHNLKANETKSSSPSPLALLKAAKEREKHRTTQSLSRESSTSRGMLTNSNSFSVIPKSSTSITPSPKTLQDNPKTWMTENLHQLQDNATVRPAESEITIQASEKPIGPISLTKDQKLSTDPLLNKSSSVLSPSVSNLCEQKHTTKEKLSQAQDTHDIPKEVSLPLLPPPPEFDDLDQIPETPPSTRPPDPPATKSPPPPLVVTNSPAVTKAPAPSPVPPQLKLPPADVHVKSKPTVQTKFTTTPTQLPPNLSPNQATLLSILQKKMLEMDQKMDPVKESDQNSDDWGNALPDEDHKVPAVPQPKPETKNPPAPTSKTASLDMRELESKVVNKCQPSTQVKNPLRNGVHSRHQYGMTFTIRPGTKQPITLVSKGNS